MDVLRALILRLSVDIHHVVEAAGIVVLGLVFYSYARRWLDTHGRIDPRLRALVTGAIFGVLTIALMMAVMAGPTRAEKVSLYAAGSLRGALPAVAKAFEAATGNKVESNYGASGLLKDEIVGGAKADVFASANMEHPQALLNAKKGGPVILFARNTLCALVKPRLTIDSTNIGEITRGLIARQ